MRNTRIPCICKFGSVTVSIILGSSLAAAEGLSGTEILSALPKGSVIASVPTKFDNDGRELHNMAAVIEADILHTQGVQAVVGYYTCPDPDENQPVGASFYARCHVAVVGKDGNGVRRLWDSGGWGFHFGMERQDKTCSDVQTCLFFQVRDVNADGKPELLFSRMSVRSEGSRFEIWGYDPMKRQLIQICDVSGSTKLLTTSGAEWPKVEARSFQASTFSTVSMQYNSNTRKYQEKK